MITAIVLIAAILTAVGVHEIGKSYEARRVRERLLEQRYHDRLNEDVRLLWAQRVDGFPHAARVKRKVQRNHGAR